MPHKQVIAVTGSTGRLGRLFRLVWSGDQLGELAPLWLTRQSIKAPDEITCDLEGRVPTLPSGCIILHLAGTVAPGREMSDHVALAVAVSDLALRSKARHVFIASTAAVYGRGDAPHEEAEKPDPASAYGRMKLAAENVFAGQPRTTCLRIGNVAGADAILGNKAPRLILDPVPDGTDGPSRSYIGPRTLARVVARLAGMAATGAALPPTLNVAQSPIVSMAALLRAADRPFDWGPENPTVIPRVELATDRLRALMPDLPQASAAGLVAERDSLPSWRP